MEFHDNMRFMKSLPLEVVGDVLVIAGDVGYLVDTTIPHIRFWQWASENYRQVLMVSGNHEYYNNGDIAAQGESWQKMFLPNVGYYHNKVVRIDNVDFILTTLWSRIPPMDELAIQNGTTTLKFSITSIGSFPRTSMMSLRETLRLSKKP
jgi:predicted phosphohydrolase